MSFWGLMGAQQELFADRPDPCRVHFEKVKKLFAVLEGLPVHGDAVLDTARSIGFLVGRCYFDPRFARAKGRALERLRAAVGAKDREELGSLMAVQFTKGLKKGVSRAYLDRGR